MIFLKRGEMYMGVLREVEMGIKKRSGERFVLYLGMCFFFNSLHREYNRIFFYRSFRVFHVYFIILFYYSILYSILLFTSILL